MARVILLLFIAVLPSCLEAAGTRDWMYPWYMPYYTKDQYKSLRQLCSRTVKALGMESGLIKDEQITASSFHSQRNAHMARLYHYSAWLAQMNDYLQKLDIDFLEPTVITAVATQGLRGSNNWVEQYTLDYSDNGENWDPVIEKNGEQKMFIANINSDVAANNTLKFPIIARHLRINPQRWHGFIAMRVEVYGCKYESHVASFTGQGQIEYNMTGPDYLSRSEEDRLRFRFRTNHPYGVIMYADSSTGDYFSIELWKGILHLGINLGGRNAETEVFAGSLLDDSQWHDVQIYRDRLNVTIIIDRQQTNVTLNGKFMNLDIDEMISIGGVSTYLHRPGVKTKQNFRGCIENLNFNYMNMIRDSKDNKPRFSQKGAVGYGCSMASDTPVTFDKADSYLQIAQSGTPDIFRVSLVFRSYTNLGVLVSGKPTLQSHFMMVLTADGHLQYTIKGLKGSQDVEDTVKNDMTVESDNDGFHDGMWHTVTVQMEKNKINVTVDEQVRITTQKLEIGASGDVLVGGGVEGYTGFLGCMRDIYISGNYIDLDNLRNVKNVGATTGSCKMRDRCHPNPCEHGGLCSQDWGTFFCDCDKTGYKGAVCHLPKYYQSCDEVWDKNQDKASIVDYIDVDGSGPLEPMRVTCVTKKETNEMITEIHHNVMKQVRVNGFQDPGSYRRKIKYEAGEAQLRALIERAYKCSQFISWRCVNSRLLSEPGSPYDFPAWGWWVGRSRLPIYSWGGAPADSGQCYCGVNKMCAVPPDQNINVELKCNCDAGGEQKDEGELIDKEHLPVMELFFGDTGTLTDNKYGFHQLGALRCAGDTLYDNVITFRKADANIEFPTLWMDLSMDISFQFKTTKPSGVFLHHNGLNNVHFIEISYHSGKIVDFRYNVGRGVESVTLEVNGNLNDGEEWHTITVERNRKQAYLRVDNSVPVVRNEPQDQGFRTPLLKDKLSIGSTVDFRSGFVGCMRALQINGALYDIRGKVARKEVTYGVSEGCIPKCASNPCLNGGDCFEGFSDYTCDCTYTPFRGYACGREVGANLDGGSMVKYTFQGEGMIATVDEIITVGFSTLKKEGILMQIINPDINEYISIELNNNGGVKCVFDVGFGRYEVNTKIAGVDLANEQQHVVNVRRLYQGRTVKIWVDDYPPQNITFKDQPKDTDTQLHNPRFIYMGRNESTPTGKGFSGCLFRAKFNNIYPLKFAYMDPPNPAVQLVPGDKTKTSGIQETMCGFEEVLHPPEPEEFRPVPPIDPNAGERGEMASRNINGAIVGGILAGIALILLLIFLFVCRHFNTRKGEYQTREAKGADGTDNPDFAILSKESHQPAPTEKREYFI